MLGAILRNSDNNESNYLYLKNQDNNPLEFQIVVTGDITGDGIADALDFISIKLHRAEVAVLQGINFQANEENCKETRMGKILYNCGKVFEDMDNIAIIDLK